MLCLIYFIASHHENLTLLSSSIVSIWRGAINEGITAGATAAGSKPVATTPSSRRVLDRWQRAGHRAGDRSWRRHLGRLRRVSGRGDFHQGITAGATAAGSKLVATTPSSRRVLDRWIRRHLDGSLTVGYAPIGYAYLAGEETFTWGQPSVG